MGICRNQSLVIVIPENESDTDSCTSTVSEMKQLTFKKEPNIIKSHYTHNKYEISMIVNFKKSIFINIFYFTCNNIKM